MSESIPAKSLSLSVLIPTWRRPVELARCLAALRRQTVPATQVVVTVRADDDLTHAKLQQLEQDNALPAGFQKVTVGPVPLTASMNAGLALTTGEYVALTDDDSEPRPDWLEKLAAVLNTQPDVGSVGGRDWQPHERGDVTNVGTVSAFGRVTGNHHLGSGPARDVDLLKGVNACFRGDELRRIGFDRRLRGRGNVSHWEMSLCFAFKRLGWNLVYDPAIGVDHHVAPRHDGDVNARGGFEPLSYADAVFNETLSVWEYLRPAQRVGFAVWAVVCGTREVPGLLQIPRLMLQGGWRAGRVAIAKMRCAVPARVQAVRVSMANRRTTSETTAHVSAEVRA